ncbi:MAG: GspH/FimT family pseudopilin [bacterium]
MTLWPAETRHARCSLVVARRAAARTRSFTLIELIVVMTIVSILAATAVPALTNRSERRLPVAASRLAAHLRLARETAMSTRRRTWVTFDPDDHWYLVQIEGEIGGGRDSRVDLAHPETGVSPFRVDLNTGDYAGVTLLSAFGGDNEVSFDRLGRPCDGTGELRSADGCVVLWAGTRRATVGVVAGTGLIEEG